ncbi:MAG: hypothetical protein J7J44_02520 [Deltaproteobacteria bacterium]|nr:hypothetical protein [Deltaproteobacteria bacterium]
MNELEFEEDWDDDFWGEVEEDEEIEPDCFGQYLLGAGSEECAFCPWAEVCAEVSKAQLKDQNKNEEEEE